MKKVRLGILGMGNMGSGHLENILNDRCPEVEVTAVCDLNPARLEFALGRLAEHRKAKPDNTYADIATFADGDEMFASGLIDAVIIAIPHYGHPDYAIKAMKAGLHVMCEKPAGVYTLQVREMMAEADKHPELKFGMMFNQRTNHIYRKVKEIMDSGELGAIRRTSWIITNWYRPQAYYDSGQWRATWSGEGGGVLLNQCPHQLDLWQWLFGMPKTMRAAVKFGKYHDIEVEDEVNAYMEYEDGKVGNFIASTGEMPGTNRLEITAERGRLVFENGKLEFIRNEIPTSEFCKTAEVAFGISDNWDSKVQIQGADHTTPQHQKVLANVADAVQKGTPLIAPMEEGIRGLELGNSMLLSGLLDKTLTLPIDSALYAAELEKLIATSRYQKKEVVTGGGDFSKSF